MVPGSVLMWWPPLQPSFVIGSTGQFVLAACSRSLGSDRWGSKNIRVPELSALDLKVLEIELETIHRRVAVCLFRKPVNMKANRNCLGIDEVSINLAVMGMIEPLLPLS